MEYFKNGKQSSILIPYQVSHMVFTENVYVDSDV